MKSVIDDLLNNDDDLLNIDDKDFYRIKGSSMAFIELLDHSNDHKHICHMWVWLRTEFETDGIDLRLIFPFFKIARQNGYDVNMLSGKLVRALIENRIDSDDTEPEWLALAFGSPAFDAEL
jgi:hypothetical protein